MAQISVDAIAFVSSMGATGGNVECIIPPSMVTYWTGITSVGMAGIPRRPDFVPSAGVFSVGVALPSCTLSVGGDGFVVAVAALGSSASATYTNLLSQVVRETWTRVQ